MIRSPPFLSFQPVPAFLLSLAETSEMGCFAQLTLCLGTQLTFCLPTQLAICLYSQLTLCFTIYASRPLDCSLALVFRVRCYSYLRKHALSSKSRVQKIGLQETLPIAHLMNYGKTSQMAPQLICFIIFGHHFPVLKSKETESRFF